MPSWQLVISMLMMVSIRFTVYNNQTVPGHHSTMLKVVATGFVAQEVGIQVALRMKLKVTTMLTLLEVRQVLSHGHGHIHTILQVHKIEASLLH